MIVNFLSGNWGGDNIPNYHAPNNVWLCSLLSGTDNKLLCINSENKITSDVYSSAYYYRAVFYIDLSVDGVVVDPPSPGDISA